MRTPNHARLAITDGFEGKIERNFLILFHYLFHDACLKMGSRMLLVAKFLCRFQFLPSLLPSAELDLTGIFSIVLISAAVDSTAEQLYLRSRPSVRKQLYPTSHMMFDTPDVDVTTDKRVSCTLFSKSVLKTGSPL